VWWGKRQIFYYKFLAESNGERILKIDQHLANLLTKKMLVCYHDRRAVLCALAELLFL